MFSRVVGLRDAGTAVSCAAPIKRGEENLSQWDQCMATVVYANECYGTEQLSYNNIDAYYSFPAIAPSSSLQGREGQVQHERIRQASLCRKPYLAA